MSTLRWQIYDPKGEHIASTQYATDAARVAIAAGIGAKVYHGRRYILSVTEDVIAIGALSIADEMITATYKHENGISL